MNQSVHIITMGCSKNLVDSERLIAMFEEKGYDVSFDSVNDGSAGSSTNVDFDIVVINTCGFIQDAKEESIDMILRYAQAKDEGRIQHLYVMGCLSQRYMQELRLEIPQVDAYYGKFDWAGLVEQGAGANFVRREQVAGSREQVAGVRHITTPGHYAYLKISEGCNRHCAYCAIPIMTGHHRSRPMEEILDEVKWLVSQGVKEFQVIAQELTYYGMDIYHKRCISELVERISYIEGVEWIRLHYAYPRQFPKDLLRVMRERPNVCKYLDVALQHISTKVLTNMRRHITKEETYDFIRMLRREVPGIHLRTTLMVGFPGEGRREFEELKEFVRWARFERMGAFAYSEEDGTWAARHFKGCGAKSKTKQQRLSELMDIQQQISSDIQAEKVGQTLRVIIDRVEGEYYVGRTEFDSPEVDPEVLIPVGRARLQEFKSSRVQEFKGSSGSKGLRIGEFYDVLITDADEFDLYGVLA